MDVNNTVLESRDLVLIGGGHSHLFVVRMLGMKPIPGLRITLISRDIHTPYSGMLPGLIAGHYQYDDAHIDLRALCETAGIRLLEDEVISLNTREQLVVCHRRPAIHYDWLSINTGSQPNLSSIRGASDYGIAVKPIANFLHQWRHFVAKLHHQTASKDIAVIGGGAASVEVALACQYHAQQLGIDRQQLSINLYSGSDQLLPSHNKRVRRYMAETLKQRGITLRLGHYVSSATRDGDNTLLHFKNGTQEKFDEVIWAINASAAEWPKQAGLSCNADGFITVDEKLRSISHNNVFAAGDVADFQSQSLAKSGVYAVRAGKFLSHNLRAAIMGEKLKRYKPQTRFLSLLMTGDKRAIASRGQFNITGKWVWRWKDSIDRRFMGLFNVATESNTLPPDLPSPARCGGCGAKISNSVLSRVLSQLQTHSNNDVAIGLTSPDDAAVISPPAGKQWLQTVDYFRAFIDDPYLLGRIATNHCLSDIYAMGGTPHSAMAIATVPYAADTLIENTLLQLMSGAVESLNQHQTALIGGHSSEGAELSFGLSVNGVIDENKILTKGNIGSGQVLILTKALGTGTLLAANMQGQAKGRWISNAIAEMLISNQRAAEILINNGASACTDITGFGLVGHLAEMLEAAQQYSASLFINKIPALDGASDTAGRHWLSSLQPDNLAREPMISNASAYRNHALYQLLFDPQTAGGLLATMQASSAKQCVEELRKNGYTQANIIGSIDQVENAPFITIV